MTEVEWLACTDPQKMLEFLRGTGRASDRKFRLFAVACCRTIWHLIQGGQSRRAVEVAERYADGEATADQLNEAARASDPQFRALSTPHLAASGFYYGSLMDADVPCAAYAAYTSVALLTAADEALDFTHRAAVAAATAMAFSASKFAAKRHECRVWKESQERGYAAQSGLLRDLIGSPFRAVRLDSAPLIWNQGTVTQLARAIYDERHFVDLPILADALEEAGCTDPALLSHLRSPGPHVRGCWAVDLLLGKE